MAEGHLEVPRGCPWPWATVKFYTFYFFLSFTCIWPLPCPHGPAPCPALQDRRTDGPCPAPCPDLPCLAARFSESRDPFSESRFPNPTVRAGSTTSIKTRNRRRPDRRTNTILALIYKIDWEFVILNWQALQNQIPMKNCEGISFSNKMFYFFSMRFSIFEWYFPFLFRRLHFVSRSLNVG